MWSTYDTRLAFKHYSEQLSKIATETLACLRRVSWFLDERSENCSIKLQICLSQKCFCLAF